MKDIREKVYVTYIYPIQFVVYENEKIDFSLSDINNLTYDHSLLHRIVGTITNSFDSKNIEYLVCGDGALGIKVDSSIAKEDIIVHYNDLLCKLFLGGMNVEAISNRDIVYGDIFESKSIWPVQFGESWNSHIHAELRMRVVGVTDAILLYRPEGRTTTIEKMVGMLNKGDMIVKAIPNLSTFHLINGITEYRHCNWPSALTFLWVIVEEITDYFWLKNIVDNVIGENSKKRKEMLKDTRTYTLSVKQEILLQIGVLDENIYNNIFKIRQARNKLVHEGKLISENEAQLLVETVKELLVLASELEVEF